ncbi:MAG: DNA mismatch repair endonuclease MutL [Bacteroidales bacterium]|nr:DNA mismatch repair endonuclease MutL [Bacteroidales bacterium]
MPELKILPGNIANMIAAGEVVQRPASVVKELMENSVDAGARSVSVVITDSGRTLIQVIDDGCGMSPDDAVLCFERHATSKIATAEDLDNILTFGFRGEALASIAAVAEVTLRTRRPDDEVGTEVVFADSHLVSQEEVAAPSGSSFAVRNIFYNVPARRKFLKSDNVEFKHIVEEFTRVALTRPDISFTLSHNGRDVFVLKPAKSLKFRILDLLGTNVVGDVVDISADTSLMRVSGFIGRPDTAKKTLGNQYFFVNGRYFRSPYLHKAVMKAYEEFIPEGLTPSYFIFLEVDPHTVDVNIHPTKSEIKFEEDNLIFRTLYACVRETLGRNSFGASIDFDNDATAQLPVFGKSFDEYKPSVSPKLDLDPDYNPFEPAPVSSDYDFSNYSPSSEPKPAKGPSGPSQYVEKHEDYGKLFESKVLPTTQILTIQDKYIVTVARSGLMVVNIRRAFERILYERFLRALSKGEHVSQASLFPEQLRVGVENRLLFDENAGLLKSLGFDITPFGNDTIVVNGVPDGFSCESGKVEAMVSDLLFILSEGHSSLSETMHSSLAEKFAILGAASAKLPSSPFEAQHLIDSLFASGNAELTSRGRRIVTIIPVDEIDKKF